MTQWLPNLTADGAVWRLPLSSLSAAILADALLSNGEVERRRLVDEALRGDPTLALWAICRRDSLGEPPPRDISDLAEWFADHAMELLEWEDRAEGAAHSTDAAALADRVAQNLSLSSILSQSSISPSADGAPAASDRPFTALPQLAKKLARLEALESRFAEELERAKLSAMKELAYGASHEINNPLANISTRAQALLREESDPERRRKLAAINSQAFRAHEMISSLMLFARPPRIDPQPVDLGSLIAQVVGELAEEARRQGTTLHVARLDVPLVIHADREQLSVAIHALVENSLEAVASGGSVEVSARSMREFTPGYGGAAKCATDVANGTDSPASPRWVAVAVSDTGPGIADEVRPHLFDPFYSGREAGRGLGLGLAQCWSIVQQHGGRIEVKSPPRQGATFTLLLPVVADMPKRREELRAKSA